MTFLPVVERELRAEARRPFSYWLRALGAGALILVAGWAYFSTVSESGNPRRSGMGFRGMMPGQNPLGDLGLVLFGDLNATLFVTLWVLVPLLTADCINREKREGTLGLLFLTPLTSTGIVVGKSMAHGLRALTLYFTMLPVLVVPLMLGGITAQDGWMAALLNLGMLMLALAAGLLASAWTRDWLKSVALAQLLSALFALAFMMAQQVSLEKAMAVGRPVMPAGGQAGLNQINFGHVMLAEDVSFLAHLRSLFALATNLPSDPQFMWNGATGFMLARRTTSWSEVWTGCPPSVHSAWFVNNGLLVCACLGVLVVATMGAGGSIERAWRETPPSAGRQRLNVAFTQPVVGRFILRRRLKRALERNPIGWLHQYSLPARFTKWGWCAFVVLVEVICASNWHDAWDTQGWVALLLLLGLTFSAAGSFARERETGALELLLVTPLRAGQIVRGRVRGIRMQYLPSIATLLVAWFSLLHTNWLATLMAPQAWDRGFLERMALPLSVMVSYLTLPVIGLYFSLRPMNHLVSWLWSCIVGLLIPCVLIGSYDSLLGVLIDLGLRSAAARGSAGESLVPLIVALAWQLMAALVAAVLLHRALAQRRIAMARTG